MVKQAESLLHLLPFLHPLKKRENVTFQFRAVSAYKLSNQINHCACYIYYNCQMRAQIIYWPAEPLKHFNAFNGFDVHNSDLDKVAQ